MVKNIKVLSSVKFFFISCSTLKWNYLCAHFHLVIVIIILRSHWYHHNYSKNRQRSMRIHLLFCFHKQPFRFEWCCKIFAKYLKNVKWISKWMGPWNTESIVDHNDWPTRKFLNSKRSRIPKTVTFWHWWQPFNSFCFEILSFFFWFPFFFLLCKKVAVGEGAWTPRSPRCCRRWF